MSNLIPLTGRNIRTFSRILRISRSIRENIRKLRTWFNSCEKVVIFQIRLFTNSSRHIDPFKEHEICRRVGARAPPVLHLHGPSSHVQDDLDLGRHGARKFDLGVMAGASSSSSSSWDWVWGRDWDREGGRDGAAAWPHGSWASERR
jgi:hypothetical protein